MSELLNRLTASQFKVESGEQVIAVLRVVKLNRRNGRDSELRILCLTVKRKEKGTNSVRLFTVKENEKNNVEGAFTIIKKYKIKKLKRIEGVGDKELIFYFENMRPLNIKTESTDEKNSFLYRLVQHCRENFGTIPKLIKINAAELNNYAAMNDDSGEEDTSETQENFLDDLPEMDQKELVTEEEEQILLKVLKQFNLDISNAKDVSSQLQQKLIQTEQENIHAILEKQEEWRDVLSQIRTAKDKVAEIKVWLQNYYKELMIMQKDIEQIEKENNDMEIQARNHQKLSDELNKFIDKLKFDEKYELIIRTEPLEPDASLKKIIDAIKVLEEAMESKLENGMDSMAAYIERTKYFKLLRSTFVTRFKQFLKKKFQKIAEAHLKDLKQTTKKTSNQEAQDQLIELPLHGSIYKELSKTQPLMKSVVLDDKETNIGSMNQLQQTYCTSMQLPYKKELQDYFYEIKQSVRKNKESKSSTTYLLTVKESGSLAQINATSMATSSSFSKASSTSNTQSSAKMTSQTVSVAQDDDEDNSDDEITHTHSTSVGISIDMRADVGFTRCITDICDIIYDEQQFCIRYFHFDSNQESVGNSELQKMLEVMFKNVLESVKSLIEFIDTRCDKSFLLPMLLITEQKFNNYQSKSGFLRFFLADVLAIVNTSLNKFMDSQIHDIVEYKCIIKKTVIIPYVAKLPLFIDRMEMLTNSFSDRYQAETLYLKVLKTVYNSIDTLANTDSKHSNAFRLKNYTFLYKTLTNRALQSADIQRLISTAEETAKSCRHSYVMWIIKGKFGDLFEFFEGVEESLKTMEVEDISYQNQFSKAKLKEIIAKHETTYQKDLASLLKRMDKHVGIDRSSTAVKTPYNLYMDTWMYLVDTFVTKYGRMEELTKKCYTNVSLTPVLEEVKVALDQITSQNKSKLTV